MVYAAPANPAHQPVVHATQQPVSADCPEYRQQQQSAQVIAATEPGAAQAASLEGRPFTVYIGLHVHVVKVFL